MLKRVLILGIVFSFAVTGFAEPAVNSFVSPQTVMDQTNPNTLKNKPMDPVSVIEGIGLPPTGLDLPRNHTVKNKLIDPYPVSDGSKSTVGLRYILRLRANHLGKIG